MAIQPSDFNVNISPNPTGAVIGMSKVTRVLFSNISDTQRGYNLSVEVILPDGVSYEDSTIKPTGIRGESDGSIIVQWINIKDLAPNEIDFELGLTLRADEIFRETGEIVPFDIPLESIVAKGFVDTLPRGDCDPENQMITKIDTVNFIPLRYDLIKSAPGKMVKGAGLKEPITAAKWPFQYTLTIKNNGVSESIVTLTDNLPNGIRYLGELNVDGPDEVILLNPTVILPEHGTQNFVTLNWGEVVLSPESVNVITFTVAIWDNYTIDYIENSGDRILHLTPLENNATLDGESGIIEATAITNAMDATIGKGVDDRNTDVGEINNYILNYKINQYDNVDLFIITDVVSDGQSYNVGSSSTMPDSVIDNQDGTTDIYWELGLREKGTSGSIVFTTTVDENYHQGNPVCAKDSLYNNVNIEGTNQITSTSTPDSSSVNISIDEPTIEKSVINIYYKDGTIKNIPVAAQGDQIEFEIKYSSEGLIASQKNIEVDEYPPHNMGPITDDIDVTYGGSYTGTFSPVEISPDGLRWVLGTIPGDKFWTATFKVPVKEIDYIECIKCRSNLAKLSGENTQGLGYSDRDLIPLQFGEPNIEFIKNVSGEDINAIKSGEIYTYSLVVSNLQNNENTTTDAFEMDLTDMIPAGLHYTGNYSVVGTGEYSTPIFDEQNVSWTINKLEPDKSLTLNFDVMVEDILGCGQIFENNAIMQRPYSQPDRSYQYPGESFISSVILKSAKIQINKTINPSEVKIGDTATYELRVIVPMGTNGYNVQVEDNFEYETQIFIDGSATKDGILITPTVNEGKVTFEEIPIVDATDAEVEIVYTFDIRVTNAEHISPFIDSQNNNAVVNWNIDQVGTQSGIDEDNKVLNVKTPYLDVTKEHRNTSTSGSFKTTTLSYNVGNIIEYKIRITNNGEETAYNTVVSDILNEFVSYYPNSIVTTHGTAVEVDGTIEWNIETLAKGSVATLLFQVNTLEGVAAGSLINNKGTFEYTTNNNGYEVTYGPKDTNITKLRAPSVTINKESSISEGEIGDDITYTLTIKVPHDTIAYTPLIEDILPIGQLYIGNATRQQLPDPAEEVIPTIIDQTVTFPINGDIDASGGEVTIIYVFDARIINAIHIPPYEETQEDEGKVRWSLTRGGSLNKIKRNTLDIIAKTPHLSILKEQKNITTGGNYTTDNIIALPTDTVYYKLTINSDGMTSAYNINIQDIFDENIIFKQIVTVPTVGSVTTSPNNIVWEIPQLENGNTAVFEYSVNVKTLTGAGSELSNQANATYNSNDVNPVTYEQLSNQINIDVPSLEVEKVANVDGAAIGDTIEYTITINVLNETSAYNMVIKDTIPEGQEYVAGSWSEGIPTIIGNKIIYNDTITQRIGAETIIYTFETVVINGNIFPPYREAQNNEVEVLWDVSLTGPQAIPVYDYANINVTVPHIYTRKEQRNVTKGTQFGMYPIYEVDNQDIIGYKIAITNDGANIAYNVITLDELSDKFNYEGVVSVDQGNIEYIDGVLNWNGVQLNVGESAELVFDVKVNQVLIPGDVINNQFETEYDTSPTNPTTLGPILSDEVSLNLNLPQIVKTINRNSVFVGDIITYTIKILALKGTIIYDVQVIDELLANQIYIMDSMTRNGVLISSPTLTFPFEGTIDATSGDKTITYTFQAIVDSVEESPQDIQINTATINWNIAQGGPSGTPQSDNAIIYVTDSEITLLKSQRNFTASGTGEFTTDDVEALVGDTIYYELSVSNPNITETIYNVKVTDYIDIKMSYDEIVIAPTVGTVTYSDRTVTWEIDSILPQTEYNMVIAVTIQFSGGNNRIISDKIEAIYSAISDPTVIYGPKQSNTVNVIINNISRDLYTLGQSEHGEIINVGEEIKIDLDLIKNPYIDKAGIIGIVSDIQGNRVENALVKILDNKKNPLYHALTDENGRYNITDIEPSSELNVYVAKQGYLLGGPVTIALREGQTTSVNLTLLVDPNAALSTIAGHVTDELGNPLQNLIAILTKVEEVSETEIATSSTNEYGQYAFVNIPIGNYIVRISGTGYEISVIEVTITDPASIIDLQTTMQVSPETSKGTINGVIKDTQGSPVIGAVVILYKVTGTELNPVLTPIRYTKTSRGGAYLFGEVPQGNYLVKSNKED